MLKNKNRGGYNIYNENDGIAFILKYETCSLPVDLISILQDILMDSNNPTFFFKFLNLHDQ